jgi:hypothetical protein
VPGVVVIRRDGHVAFRQVATSKDDRLTAPELIGVLDRTLATTGPVARRVTPLAQTQLRAEAGVEVDKDRGVHGIGALSLLVPLGDHLVVGPWLAVDTRVDHVDVAGVAMLRAPLLGDAAAFALGAIAGYATGTASAVLAPRTELWFATSPTTAFDIAGSFELRRDVRDAVVTFGFSHLLGAGRPRR